MESPIQDSIFARLYRKKLSDHTQLGNSSDLCRIGGFDAPTHNVVRVFHGESKVRDLVIAIVVQLLIIVVDVEPFECGGHRVNLGVLVHADAERARRSSEVAVVFTLSDFVATLHVSRVLRGLLRDRAIRR